ncbi:MAG TPA: photosynthetic reaction center subunit H [Polyangiaceae bacterium LLY-WYZ-14_1]|jgi:photosynthetic reaction center H subunit|nr:photosynthetic reaction center subunit H [Polyangiaceae bacterium LLY-WYZ-14_1]
MEFTQYIDFAQVSLYVFWVFFFGLIYWLRIEDRREGYPKETDNPRSLLTSASFLLPKPKTYIRPDGSTLQLPNAERDDRPIPAKRAGVAAGSAIDPSEDPMMANVGPSSYAERHDEPELTREGHIAIVPMRTDDRYSVSAGADPRGFDVVAADGKKAGKVVDVWVDRAELQARYLEVELDESLRGESAGAGEGGESAAAPVAGAHTRLLPTTMGIVKGASKTVDCSAVRAEHFPKAPTTKHPEQITVNEEERIMAFFAGGRLYAEPSRLGPIV